MTTVNAFQMFAKEKREEGLSYPNILELWGSVRFQPKIRKKYDDLAAAASGRK